MVPTVLVDRSRQNHSDERRYLLRLLDCTKLAHLIVRTVDADVLHLTCQIEQISAARAYGYDVSQQLYYQNGTPIRLQTVNAS